jgi:hypothetical protein
MSTWDRRRVAHQATRNNGWQDPELAALLARGHSLLAVNWRKRVRGYSRSPLRPPGVELPIPSLNGDPEIADVETRGSTNGTAPRQGTRRENRDQKDAEAGVLAFPEIVLPLPDKPVRGPLSWAYWSARRK